MSAIAGRRCASRADTDSVVLENKGETRDILDAWLEGYDTVVGLPKQPDGREPSETRESADEWSGRGRT
jgi:hypothetical protein